MIQVQCRIVRTGSNASFPKYWLFLPDSRYDRSRNYCGTLHRKNLIIMQRTLLLTIAMLTLASCAPNHKESMQTTQEWDKVFPLSESVSHRKVEFRNQYGITLVGDLYSPKSGGNGMALAVCGPFGATKEQSSGLYAMKMAERGFITCAFDPSFTGESGGEPRRTASPDINTEDFLAAVDFLCTLDEVDEGRIGIIGICGWGGIALNAAAVDPRIKATVASTMYDMCRVNGNGYFDESDSEEARYAARKAMAAERTEAARSGRLTQGGGVVDPLPDDAPQFVKVPMFENQINTE